MTERKWTPGTWFAAEDSEGFWVIDSDGYRVGSADAASHNPKANAHLIAAAPDLYEALDNLWSWVEGWNAEFMDDIEFDRSVYQKALYKARGEQ